MNNDLLESSLVELKIRILRNPTYQSEALADFHNKLEGNSQNLLVDIFQAIDNKRNSYNW